MALKIGINGFGRIGRIVFRTCVQRKDLEISAINDPALDTEYICYLIKYDSTHGRYNGQVYNVQNEIFVNGKPIKVFHEKQPFSIPWGDAGVEYVVEASGFSATLDQSLRHFTSDGIKLIVVTAPSVDVPMVILGVNDNIITADVKMLSTASSTLCCLAPVVEVLERNFGIVDGFVTIIHAMTPSLKPLDSLCIRGKHWRDHRSIHQNIIPAATGACKALGKIIPQVKDKLAGIAFRVPIVDVSVLDLSVRLKTETSLENVLRCFYKATKTSMKGIISINKDQSVSSDFIGDSHSCIIDAGSCLQLKPDYYKIICWYENEYSYACRVLDCITTFHKKLTSSINRKRSGLLSPCKLSYLAQTCSEPFNTFGAFSIPLKSTFMSNEQLLLKKFGSNQNPNPFSSYRKKVKTAELFRIWNHGCHSKSLTARKRPTFQSCVKITSSNKISLSSLDKLNNAKKELDKMSSITESLLKKSVNKKDDTSEGDITSPVQHCDKVLGPKAIYGNISHDNKYAEGDCKENRDLNEIKQTTTTHDDDEIFQNTKRFDFNRFNKNLLFRGLQEKSIFSFNISMTPLRLKSKKLLYRKPNDKFAKSYNLSEHVITKKPKVNKQFHLATVQESRNIDTGSMSKINLISEKYEEAKLNLSDNVQSNDNHTENNSNVSLNFSTNNGKLILEVKLSETDSKRANNQDSGLFSNNSEICGAQSDISTSKSALKIESDGVITLDNFVDETNGQVHQDIVKELPSPTQSDVYHSLGRMRKSGLLNIKSKSKDIFDKLDSVSGSDSEGSFEINKRKSQVIHITDLTTSLEDLNRLDKICKILEISDELSDNLFSCLTSSHAVNIGKNKWSFKDLCEKIKLDEFCDKIFGKL